MGATADAEPSPLRESAPCEAARGRDPSEKAVLPSPDPRSCERHPPAAGRRSALPLWLVCMIYPTRASPGRCVLALPAIAGAGRSKGRRVGGGFGGATAARALEAGGLDVTLVEANPTYVSCPFSNEVIAGLQPMEAQRFGYERPRPAGIRVVHAAATGDRCGRPPGGARRRDGPPLRPARPVAGHRPALRRHSRLRRGGGRRDAPCLEGGRADAASATPARRDAGWRHRGDVGAGQPLSLPARPLRAREPDRPCPQDAKAAREADRARRQGHVLEAAPVPAGLGGSSTRTSSNTCRWPRAGRSPASTRRP